MKECPVCQIQHDYPSTVILKTAKDNELSPQYKLCQNHETLFKEGYLAVVACLESSEDKVTLLNLHKAHRTGDYTYVRKDFFQQCFDIDGLEHRFMIFCDPETIPTIIDMEREHYNLTTH